MAVAESAVSRQASPRDAFAAVVEYSGHCAGKVVCETSERGCWDLEGWGCGGTAVYGAATG